MGYAGDVLGVDIAMGFALSLAAVSAIMSALLPFGRARDVYLIIIGCRFLMVLVFSCLFADAVLTRSDRELAWVVFFHSRQRKHLVMQVKVVLMQ